MSNEYFTLNSTIEEVINHPDFKDFGRYILPLDRHRHNPKMQMHFVSQLLIYHQNLSGQGIVNCVNYMLKGIREGSIEFLDFYTEEEKKADKGKHPVNDKDYTGMFFFKGKKGAPFAMVAPGGAGVYVGSVHEGFPYALELQKLGYNVFVVQYRCEGLGVEMQCMFEDFAKATEYVLKHADELEVSKENYSVWGSSAGGRMCQALCNEGGEAYGTGKLKKPCANISIYYNPSGFHPTDDVANFSAVGDIDSIASAASMEKKAKDMEAAGYDVEFYLYHFQGHGFGLGQNTPAEGWFDLAVDFWEKQQK